MPAASSRIVRISTEMFPERERFSAFREEFVRRILAMDVIDLSGGRPHSEIKSMTLGAAAVGTNISAAAEFIRDKHHVVDGSSEFHLTIVDSGTIQFTQAGEERTCNAGSACFIDYRQPWRGRGLCARNSTINVRVQPAALEKLVSHPQDLAGRAVHPGPALRLLDGYLRSLASLEQPPSPDLAPIVSAHLVDLVAAAIGPTAEAGEIVAKRGVKAARVRAILAVIARRFSEPALDLDSVARTLGLSRRYIQQLLEETGKSFVGHLLERRLERAFTMLSDRRSFHLAIIDIAFASGFGDVSYFNRVFRRRFGDTPSGVRAAAIGQKQT